MKIVVLSDFHLGFSGKGRENDAFFNLKNAFELATAQKPDLMLVLGDVFDASIPKQENLVEAFQCFNIPRVAEKSNVKLIKEKNEQVQEVNFNGIPVIAIHGTHEFRGKDFKNALEVLESAGFIVYVHGGKIIVKKGDEKLAVHCLGGVPEKKALEVLKHFNPEPVENAFNTLLLHQSFTEFLPFGDEMVATLSLSDLPSGFDLFLNGHFHWFSELNENGKHLVIPGSTIITQMKELESKKPKGILVIDTPSKKIEFLEIPNQRKFFFKKLKFENCLPEQVREQVRTVLTEFISTYNGSQKPLIKIVLKGSLGKGLTQSDIEVQSVVDEFSEKALIFISKKFSETSFKKKIQDLAELQKSKKSVIKLGLEMLEKNLAETNFDNAFDIREMFSLLEQGENEKALKILTEEK